jgi:hypothetical protein
VTGDPGVPARWTFELTTEVMDVHLTAIPPEGFQPERASCAGQADEGIETRFRRNTVSFAYAPVADLPLRLSCRFEYVGAGVPPTALEAEDTASDQGAALRILLAILSGLTALCVRMRAPRFSNVKRQQR